MRKKGEYTEESTDRNKWQTHMDDINFNLARTEFLKHY